MNLLANPLVVTYISNAMTGHLKKITAFLLILLNLAVAVAPHFGHTDEAISFGATVELRAHTCGANEIHKDIKGHSDCLLCSRTTHFVAFVVSNLFNADHDVTFFVSPAHEISYHHDSTSPVYLRGPPAILS